MSPKTTEDYYEAGFLLGGKLNDGLQIYFNHVHLRIHYHKHRTAEGEVVDQYNIVLFEVHPYSVEYGDGKDITKLCKNVYSGSSPQLLLSKSASNKKVYYTYSVEWMENTEIDWSHRWHSYRALQGSGQVHWFSIVNSLMVIFLMSGMIAAILAKTLRRDFVRMEEEKGLEDETGWKILYGEVSRPPVNPTLLCVLVGSGTQVVCMVFITMVFSVLGFLSPANQGSFMTAMLVLYVWMGVAAGYSSSRLYQVLEGERTVRNTLLTAFTFPGTIFGIAFILNFFLQWKKSSAAFSVSTMSILIALWFCISVPLCYLGSRIAYNKEPIKFKKPNLVPRPIPPQPWYYNKYLNVITAGVIPFGAVFIELSFIMSSIWLHRYYFLFSFLFLVLIILFITCVEISIVLCYFQLCSLDWEWWWRAFLNSGASVFYVFLYAVYCYTKLDIEGSVASLLYFGYTLILCLGFFVLTGTIGFCGTFYFVRKIYAAVHQD
eukprot:TRINITY_DN3954_c0_g1_i6.p1 TRINITY_DN3954_c0_g1~~TRINITY_DN3954_c0_g1_i6.p1  ORF type:complete len:489 (+),score=59.27 TRINITY_DN3954_c0_g1_i6:534-2000(+)